MREKEKVKKMKKVEEEDEEGEEEQRKEKSTLFFIFSPLSSTCFSSISSISIHCFLLCCLPSAREKENIFFSFVVALWVGGCPSPKSCWAYPGTGPSKMEQ
jgi:hypothetical protein